MGAKKNLVRLEVLNPTSEVSVSAENAKRLDTLNGKTICELWATGHWAGEKTFPMIRELLRQRYRDVKFVPYTEFPFKERGFSTRESYEAYFGRMGDLLKPKGCDAVIVGNGG